jgi:hypothetical protein
MAAGLDSLGAVELRNGLEARFGLQLPGTLVFDHPSVAALSGYLHARVSASAEAGPQQAAGHFLGRSRRSSSIRAAAGPLGRAMGGPPAAPPRMMLVEAVASRCPLLDGTPLRGASSAGWQLPRRDPVTAVPLARWDLEQALQQQATAARFGAFLGGVDLFDAPAFGLSGAEAALMDPQQRLLLEAAAEALQQSAGGAGDARRAVFVGVASSDYGGLVKAHTRPGAFHATANAASVAAGRVSFAFGLLGPCASVDTACSSSLVALHLGGGAVAGGEARSALVAGVHVLATATSTGYVWSAGMLSPSGRWVGGRGILTLSWGVGGVGG